MSVWAEGKLSEAGLELNDGLLAGQRDDFGSNGVAGKGCKHLSASHSYDLCSQVGWHCHPHVALVIERDRELRDGDGPLCKLANRKIQRRNLDILGLKIGREEINRVQGNVRRRVLNHVGAWLVVKERDLEP